MLLRSLINFTFILLLLLLFYLMIIFCGSATMISSTSSYENLNSPAKTDTSIFLDFKKYKGYNFERLLVLRGKIIILALMSLMPKYILYKYVCVCVCVYVCMSCITYVSLTTPDSGMIRRNSSLVNLYSLLCPVCR